MTEELFLLNGWHSLRFQKERKIKSPCVKRCFLVYAVDEYEAWVQGIILQSKDCIGTQPH